MLKVVIQAVILLEQVKRKEYETSVYKDELQNRDN